jgi:hypothetical protein
MKYSWYNAKNCADVGLREMKPKMKGVSGRLESRPLLERNVKSEVFDLNNVLR